MVLCCRECVATLEELVERHEPHDADHEGHDAGPLGDATVQLEIDAATYQEGRAAYRRHVVAADRAGMEPPAFDV